MENASLVQHNNFRFTARINQPKRTIKKPRQTRQKRPKLPVPNPTLLPELDLNDLPPVLKNYVILIQSNPRSQLQSLAEGLGATVKQEMEKAVTHVVITKETLKEQRLIHAYEKKSIICVSPKWLLTCYSTQQYHSPLSFPVEMNDEQYILNDVHVVENPFEADYIDFDAIEQTKAMEGQLRMDQFLIPPPPEPTQEEEAPLMLSQEVAEQEYFYNQDCPSSMDPSQQKKRKEEAEKRNLQAQRYIEQRQKESAAKPSTSELTIRSLASHNQQSDQLFGQERLRVWYGEQAKSAVKSKRKRG
ncbi:hypothetical protein EDC96DRAFT_526359 [Choanephora cucurbitarum]|nr:hypothetical protein EDC96DRAFT_526359 [Choanephora cucurbitarum]